MTTTISGSNGIVFPDTTSLSTTPPASQVKAWVNFNGGGTVAIRAGDNVASITDNTTGDYTVNFTTAMVDANYSLVSTCQFNTSSNEADHNLMSIEIKNIPAALTTNSARIVGKYGGAVATYDMTTIAVAIFR